MPFDHNRVEREIEERLDDLRDAEDPYEEALNSLLLCASALSSELWHTHPKDAAELHTHVVTVQRLKKKREA